MIKSLTFLILLFTSAPILAAQQKYETPPSKTTMGAVPIISDEKMEQCVKLYNEALWLRDELQSSEVDLYDEAAVEAYNNKVSQHGVMISKFNQECAGKQSQSACEAAQKLNREQGLPVKSCGIF